VSRLARSSADLQRLLELCSLSDTLIIDSDGTYDPAQFNDRLLLGLKGTMSEAELHLLTGRLHGAKQAAAGRGALRFPLPVGYVYDEARATVLDPDEEIQAAVRDLFAAFTATGSAYGVVGAFAERRTGRPFDVEAVRWVRFTHRIRSRPLLAPGELTVDQVATHLGSSASAVYYWIGHSQLEARRGPAGRLCVPFSSEVARACRERMASSRHLPKRTQNTLQGDVV